MTSKGSLNNIKNILREDENIWEYNEDIEQIEKDLEILEIIKRKLIIATNYVSFIAYDNDEEYNKIMEWVINEINKNKENINNDK